MPKPAVKKVNSPVTSKDLIKELEKAGNTEYAKVAQYFFKTGKGQYGEGDIFIGVRVPHIRKIAALYTDLPLNEVAKLIKHPVHEMRMAGALILVKRCTRKSVSAADKKEIFDFYLANAARFNNWDLVDLSAPQVVGNYLLDKNRSILKKLARSKSLWEKRISIMATFAFIKNKEYTETFEIADLLFNDEHDLIQKAAGWMLREAGNRNSKELEKYLLPRYKKMPRTMLRYAVEKFPESKRKRYLKGEV